MSFTSRPSARNSDAVGDRRGGGVVGDHHDRLAVARRPSRAAARGSPRSVLESRLPVGSSANSTVGLRDERAARSATRCCWPPESSAGRCVRRSARPTLSISSSTHALSGFAPASDSGSDDVLLGREHREQVEELEDEADVRGGAGVSSLSSIARDVLAVDRTVPGGRAGRGPRAVHQRGLARARRPHHGGELAARDLEGHAAEGVDGRLALAVAACERSATTTFALFGTAHSLRVGEPRSRSGASGRRSSGGCGRDKGEPARGGGRWTC